MATWMDTMGALKPAPLQCAALPGAAAQLSCRLIEVKCVLRIGLLRNEAMASPTMSTRGTQTGVDASLREDFLLLKEQVEVWKKQFAEFKGRMVSHIQHQVEECVHAHDLATRGSVSGTPGVVYTPALCVMAHFDLALALSYEKRLEALRQCLSTQNKDEVAVLVGAIDRAARERVDALTAAHAEVCLFLSLFSSPCSAA